MNFPDWAPEWLMACLEEELRIDREQDEPEDPFGVRSVQEVMARFLTDSRMEKVWKSYRKRLSKSGPSDADEEWDNLQREFYLGLHVDCLDQIGGTEWQKTPKEAKRKMLVDLNASLATASQQLGEIPLWRGGRILPYLKEADVNHLIKNMPLHYGRELFEGLTQEEVLKHSSDLVYYVLQECGLIGDIIAGLRDKILIDIEALDEPQLIVRPNTQNAEITKFVRNICLWHRQRFGSPLYENAAILASVLFQRSVDTSTVIESFRPIKDKEGLETTWKAWPGIDWG